MGSVYKAIEIQIYPRRDQEILISKTLGCCRFVYNKCLEYRQTSYQNGVSVSPTDTVNHITGLKDEFIFLKEVNSKVLQQSVRDLNTAFSNFFKKKSNYPKFKSRKDYRQSCRFSNQAFSGIKGNRISLITGLKDILFKCSRRDEKFLNRHKNEVVSITLTRTCSGKYLLSIRFNVEPCYLPDTDNVIGLDLGIKDFAVDSNGKRYPNMHFKRDSEKILKRLHRRLNRKRMVPTGKNIFSKKWNKEIPETRPSKNRNKARIKLAKKEEHIANKRKTYLQQLSSTIVRENQVIVVEDLSTKGMMHNHKLAKHIQDCGWSMFVNMLEYKCAKYGRTLVKIDRFYPSSKRCNCCGNIYRNLKLSEREWVCTSCGSVIDRDYNASRNILEEGLRILNEQIGLSSPESKPAENPTVDDRRLRVLRSSGSMKQEKNVNRLQ